MNFFLSKKEQENFNNWFIPHKKFCKYWQLNEDGCLSTSPIRGALSYVFTPTGIGLGIDVKCVCGEIFDVTDYDSW